MTLKALNMGRANLEEFSATLIELGQKSKNILAVTSDSRGSGKLGPFAEKLPDQIVEVGIAEQNLVGVSAGLASADKSVFAVSPACFLATRSLEQIKNDVAYSNQPVTLVGISAGVSYGALGTTHHSLHDVAALRAINNIQIVVPADNFETREVIIAAAKSEKPIFLKFGKKAMPTLPRVKHEFEIGKASTICEGSDVAFIACGETVAPSYEAAQLLEKEGISAEVISMHTINPLDKQAIIDTAKKSKAVITIEEHSIHGGLGEACASVLMQEQIVKPFKIVGIPDEDTVTGSQGDIFKHYGITAEGLQETTLKLLKSIVSMEAWAKRVPRF
ncbi:transketolase C-terminal domain-containing protein [uncultured Sunxiuqinia sp.]|uniref:transketolase family protein n=1 Tax=uncultured Sunxiuqinia sp. TaxID=1573825 RepID=UPI002AA72E73|nr:transketolase C-terminal domain-containing protein [uncultured Sunxiuqinia sp.]